jgi:hypothetical protein
MNDLIAQIQELLNSHWKTTLAKRYNAGKIAPLIAGLLEPKLLASKEAEILSYAISEIAERCWQQLGTEASIRIQKSMSPLMNQIKESNELIKRATKSGRGVV